MGVGRMNAIITGVVVLVGLLLVLEAVVWHFPQFVGWIIGFFGALYFLMLYLRLGLQIDMVFAVVASIVFLLIVEPFLWRVFASLKVGLGPGMYQQSRSPRLNMGRINYYTVIIPRLMLWSFLKRGWQQDFCFSGFLYRARLWQTVVIGRPATLINLDPKTLIGQRITAFDVSYGNYGMGGPGFFGITLSEQPEDHKVLVYAVWNADVWSAMAGAKPYLKHRQSRPGSDWMPDYRCRIVR